MTVELPAYLARLDAVSDDDIIRAYTEGDIELPELHSSERISGITLDSLDALSGDDWRDWFVGRLLTGEAANFRPHYTGRDEMRTDFFSDLVDSNADVRLGTPVQETFVYKMMKGYVAAVPVLVDETIPPSKIAAGHQPYDKARKDLMSAGIFCFGDIIPALGDFAMDPSDTRDEQADRLNGIVKILQDHLG